MSELGVCNVDQLSIVKEIVEKRGMHHLSHKKSTCTKIWKYMFEQLSLGLERKNFRKEGNLFLIIVRPNFIVIETIQRQSIIYKSFEIKSNDSVEKILNRLNQTLNLYNLTVKYPETRKKQPKIIIIEEKYTVEFAEKK